MVGEAQTLMSFFVEAPGRISRQATDKSDDAERAYSL